MDKQLTFSFQNHRSKQQEFLRRCEQFNDEISQIQQTRQSRSKSSTDMHSVTTADVLILSKYIKSRNNYQTDVSSFIQVKKSDVFAQSLNKIILNQSNKETQTDGLTRLQNMQEKVNLLLQQKEDILQQIKMTMKENQQCQLRNKQLEAENQSLKQQHLEYQQQLNGNVIREFTQNEQDILNKELLSLLAIKQDRIEHLKGISITYDLKEEIIQLKKSHNDKLKELMERIKLLQSSNIEPELLSTQESLQLIANVLHRAIKSNEMMNLIKQNSRLTTLIDDLQHKIKSKLEHSRTFSLHKTEYESTSKKYSQRKL